MVAEDLLNNEAAKKVSEPIIIQPSRAIDDISSPSSSSSSSASSALSGASLRTSSSGACSDALLSFTTSATDSVSLSAGRGAKRKH